MDVRTLSTTIDRDDALVDRDAFAKDLREGLRATPKRIPCKYFYDAEGSHLFEEICALPEYYQTRTEIALLESKITEIAALIGEDAELIELGAGSLRKIRILLDALVSPRAYVPIDISGDFLRQYAEELAADYPDLRISPVVADFTKSLILPRVGSGRRIAFFPGSTIGNFEPPDAARLLATLPQWLDGGGLLIGVDLVKDPAVLHAAYNDSACVTAAFNKNLLVRANRELGADFNLKNFAHYACYNPVQARIEMYLVSLSRHNARVAGERFSFAQGEAIHTENSYKYTIGSFSALAAAAGLGVKAVWTDPSQWFGLFWLEEA
jgi:dimethylhistidine N-methyltransferase